MNNKPLTGRESSILALLVLASCQSWPTEPPKHFSISDEFSTEQAEVIRAAIDAWCVKTDDCPTEGLWSERGRFMLTDNLSDSCDEGCETQAINDSGVIWIDRNSLSMRDLGELYMTVAHEWGHSCARHTQTGIMAARRPAGLKLEVDEAAVEAWFAGCP